VRQASSVSELDRAFPVVANVTAKFARCVEVHGMRATTSMDWQFRIEVDYAVYGLELIGSIAREVS